MYVLFRGGKLIYKIERMKKMKKFIALLISCLMLISAQTVFGLEFTKVTENIPKVKEASNSGNVAQMILENDKYIFVAQGRENWKQRSAVQIYDKTDGALLKTITLYSGSGTSNYCPLRDMYIKDDILYVSWGNRLVISNGAITTAARSTGNVSAPVKAYDVSNVSVENELKEITIDSGNAYSVTNHAPYVWGGISYLNEDDGKLYTSKVMSKKENRRIYTIYETSEIAGAVNANSIESLTKKYFVTNDMSMDAAQFIIKDGWLYEILQQNGGLKDVTASNSLVDSEGNALNNMVRIYDLNNLTPSTELDGKTVSVADCMRGVYTTSVSGTAAIVDIEVVGDYMYLATTDGIEIVSIKAAKENAEETAVVLTAEENKVKEDGIGYAMDLDEVNGLLYAAYTGPEVYSAPNSTESSEGALVVYDLTNRVEPKVHNSIEVEYGLAKIAINEKSGMIYMLNDTAAPASVTACAYSVIAPSFKTGVSFGEQIETVTKNIDILTSPNVNSAQMITENNKYIFAVIGLKGENFRRNSAVQIYDKADGTLLKTITLTSGASGATYCPIRDIYVKDDVLYVSWGNNISIADGEVSSASRSEGGTVSAPVKAYDVSNVSADSTLSEITIDSGNAYSATKHAPYVWGGISYLDEDNGKLYTSKVMSKSENRRIYTIYETSEISDAINVNSTESLTKKYFVTKDVSMNASQFMIKDGWLYEVLQQNGGLVDVTASNSLVDEEGNALNNMVRIYDLNNLTPSTVVDGKTVSVANCMRGVYTTSVEGTAAIVDVEVIGDYMYLATTEGIEVVSIKAAKENTDETAVVLNAEANKIKEDAIGYAMDLDEMNGLLYAAYTGDEVYSAPSSKTGDGALFIYDVSSNPATPTVMSSQTVSYGIADIEINEKEKTIYMLNDTAGPSSMTAYSYFETPISIISGEDKVTNVTAGVYDISVDMVNPDCFLGTIICAFYSNNRLADVLVKNDVTNGNILLAEDYEISSDITKIKVMYISSFGNIKPLTHMVSMTNQQN